MVEGYREGLGTVFCLAGLEWGAFEKGPGIGSGMPRT